MLLMFIISGCRRDRASLPYITRPGASRVHCLIRPMHTLKGAEMNYTHPRHCLDGLSGPTSVSILRCLPRKRWRESD
jgi:hypothetical protein